MSTKSAVLIVVTILSGLSENKIVLSDTSFNSKVYVVSLISDIEPDYTCCIAKNLGTCSVVFSSCSYTNVVNDVPKTRTESVESNITKVKIFFINYKLAL